MEILLAIVCCVIVTVQAYNVYNFESFCGKSINITKADTTGVILLDYKAVPTEEKSSTCTFSLSTGDKNLSIGIALKGVHFSDCKSSGLQITVFNRIYKLGALEFGNETVFNTNPRFCGKEIVSPQPKSVSRGHQKVSFVYREKNGTQQDYFAFYYSVHSVNADAVWPVVTTTTGAPITTTAPPSTSTKQNTTAAVENTTAQGEITGRAPLSTNYNTQLTTTEGDTDPTTEPDQTTTGAPTQTSTEKAWMTSTHGLITTDDLAKASTDISQSTTKTEHQTTLSTDTKTSLVVSSKPTTTQADAETTNMMVDTTTKNIEDTTTGLLQTSIKTLDTTTKETGTATSSESTTMQSKQTTARASNDRTTTTMDNISTTTSTADTSTKLIRQTTKSSELTTSKEYEITTHKESTMKPKLVFTTGYINSTTTEVESTTVPVESTTQTVESTTASSESSTSTPTIPTTNSHATTIVVEPTTTTEATTAIVETTTKPTTMIRTRPTPVDQTTRGSHATQTRLCKCEILVKGYGGNGVEKKIDVSYVMSQFVRGSIQDSNCHDQYRCNGICDQYMAVYMASGLDTRRRIFGEETVGDYVCSSIGQLVLNNKPAAVAYVANARGCTGHSFVSILSYKFCCVGSAFSFKSESCSKAPESLAYPPTTTPYIPTTTLPTTRYRPTAIATAPTRTRRCKCEMLVQISGEEDRKIDVSYVAYRFFRGSIDNSDCTDQYRCSSLCRDHMDRHLSDGLDSLRNKFGKETAGDYICHKIGHEVLSNKPANVTLVTSASGCTGHSHVTSLNSRLCCVGRTLSWQAIECDIATLQRRDSPFG